MYAVIETGSKQFKVKVGDFINVEKLSAQAGDTYTFDKVLGLFNGDKNIFGTPTVSGATVTGEVVGDFKAKKVIVFKYKAKKGFRKKKGHRQPYTRVKIEAINE